jgi:hypothetical protein
MKTYLRRQDILNRLNFRCKDARSQKIDGLQIYFDFALKLFTCMWTIVVVWFGFLHCLRS